MSFLNRLPERLSTQRFLALLHSLSKPLTNNTLNPGFFPFLDNLKTHFPAYLSDPSLRIQLRAVLISLHSQPQIWPIVAGRLPTEVTALLKSNSRDGTRNLSKDGLLTLNEYQLLQHVEQTCHTSSYQSLDTSLTHVIPLLPIKTLCKLLIALTRNGTYPSNGLIWAAEQRLLSRGEEVRVSDFGMALRALNSKECYERVTQGFWHGLAEKLVGSLTADFPAGLCLSYAQRSAFYVPLLFARLVPLWQQRTAQGLLNEFKEGLIGVSLSPFATKEILEYGETQACKAIEDLRPYDLVQLLRISMLNSRHSEQYWALLLSKIREKTLSDNDKLTLYGAIRGLELENSPLCANLMRNHTEQWKGLKATFRLKENGSNASFTEEDVGKRLQQAGISYTRLVSLLDLYTVDYVIGKAVLEFVGGPYHISQVDRSLDLRTQVKVRHLLGSGLSVVLVVDLVEFAPRLRKALDCIATASRPVAVLVGGTSLGQNFIRSVPIVRIQ